MSDKQSKTILNLQSVINEIASPKNHTWKDGDAKTYGKGNGDTYGHVKLVGTIPDDTTSDNEGASVSAIKSYISSKITPVIKDTEATIDDSSLLTGAVIKKLINQLVSESISKLSIENIIYQKAATEDEEDKTLEDALTDINTAIEQSHNPNNIDLTSPKSVENDIDSLKTPGYYTYDKEEDVTLNYNGTPSVHCKDALITVEAQSDGNVIQYILATTPSGNLDEYKITGEKYVRVFDGEEWSPLSLIYTPQKNRSVSPTEALMDKDGNTTGNITMTETTAGFTFNWHQYGEGTYTIQSDLYEYEKIGGFESIPIGNTPFIFGNLIGKIDIKIDAQGIFVRSTLPSGSVVKNVNTTFFIPRIE